MTPNRLNARERLNGAAVERGVARLNGWSIRFDLYSITNGCGATDIIQSAPEYVLGILYDVPTRLVIAENQQRSRMDEIERARPDGNGNYQRLTVNVDFHGSNIEAITYAGTRRGRERFAAKTPQEQRVSVKYFGHLETGAAKLNFPDDYRAYLKAKAGSLRP
jgi:hypothetical protein